jgi:Zn-dependent protease
MISHAPGVRLGRVRGIDVRAQGSWFAVVALIVWSFWARFTAQGHGGAEALAMALGGAVLFAGSLLAHELAHALEGLHRGVPVHSITLFLFGGATAMGEPRRPQDQFALTVVGPFTSLTLAAVFGILATAASRLGLGAAAETVGLVGWLNAGLAVFNLLPGAPLDGGRIVRAVAWRITGNPYRATRIAAQAGRVLGALLVALGLAQVFFSPAGFGDGLWLAFIGWFLSGAANQELAYARLQEQLAGVPLGLLAGTARDLIPAESSVSDAIEGWFRPLHDDAFLVVDDGDRPVGVLRVEDVRDMDAAARGRVRVREAMRPVGDLPTLPPDAPASSLLERLAEQGAVVVADGGSGPGIVTPRSLLTRLNRLEELDGGSRSQRRGTGRSRR